jgi:hypothetical protein
MAVFWRGILTLANNFDAVEQKTADISIPVAVTVFPGKI